VGGAVYADKDVFYHGGSFGGVERYDGVVFVFWQVVLRGVGAGVGEGWAGAMVQSKRGFLLHWGGAKTKGLFFNLARRCRPSRT